MREILVSDWTVAAFKRREEDRRKNEAAEVALVVAQDAKLRTEGILVSDWTLAALKRREEERRKNEAAQATLAAAEEQKQRKKEFLVSDRMLAALKRREEERSKKEEAEVALVVAEEAERSTKGILVSDWTLATLKRREDACCKTEGAEAALAELARLVDANKDTQKRLLQPQSQRFSAILQDSRNSTECKGLQAREPVLNGDFAEINVEFLSARGHEAAALSDASQPDAFADPNPDAKLKSRDRPYESGAMVSRDFGVADKEIRSRRSAYVVAAIIIVGLGGLVASLGLQSGILTPTETIKVKAESEGAKSRPEMTTGGDVSRQDASIPNATSQLPPLVPVNNAEQPVDVPRAQQGTPRVDAPGGASKPPTEAADVAAPSAQTRAQEEPRGIAATPVEEEKVWTATIRPDGTLVRKGEMLPVAPTPTSRLPAAAPTSTPETVERVETTPRPAALDNLRNQGRPGQTVNKSKAKAAADSVKAKVARPAEANPESAPQPAPATNGSLGFVQRAADSITNAIKELGRNATGSRP